LAAALIVFVEALKELPATLILRPFNFDTLAVRAYAYASDERLTQAAAPALLIVLAGLLPTLLLSSRIERARAGRRP
jgi:iron(III) transport system permease protein